MDAPKGRYRVEEKGGRLVVIDTQTGAPASSSPAPAPPPQPRSLGSDPSARLGRIGLYGRLLLRLVVNRWDEAGRAVIAWEWKENGRTRRWDALLGPAEQRRLAHGLAAFSAFPLIVLAAILFGPEPLWFLPVALPLTFWGVWSVMRLRRDTGGGG